MFIDALDQYYVGFYADMRAVYDEWRARSFGRERMAKKKVHEGVLEAILGVGIIAGGIVAAAAVADDDVGHSVFEGAWLAGMEVIGDGIAKTRETPMHREELKELGESLDSDVAPRVIKVQGEITRLTGSVETQYAAWRELLRQIYVSETRVTLEPN